MGVYLAGLRNVKGSTVAAVEWTNWKAGGDEVREVSGSLRGFELGQAAADFHGDSTSGLQPEREVSGVSVRKESRQKTGLKVVWTRAGAGSRDGAAEMLAVPRRQNQADFPKAGCGLWGDRASPFLLSLRQAASHGQHLLNQSLKCGTG